MSVNVSRGARLAFKLSLCAESSLALQFHGRGDNCFSVGLSNLSDHGIFPGRIGTTGIASDKANAFGTLVHKHRTNHGAREPAGC